MAEEKPSLHIDTDWKKQAQEEKKRLAEEEAKRAAARQPAAERSPAAMGGMAGLAADVAASTSAPAASAGPASPARGRRGERGTPEASFAGLVQSTMTQVLYYLGDLAVRGAEPNVNLDMAKYHIDTLGVLEEKTKGNLSADEQKVLDQALYETRMRFVSVASQLLGP